MTIEDLLKELEDKILHIKKRFYYLTAIVKELSSVTDGKLFTIRNDILYQMVWDSHEMLIIDLASLYRGMCQTGGFFGILKVHSAKLRTISPKNIKVNEPRVMPAPGSPMTEMDSLRIKREIEEDTQKMIAVGVEKALIELFPDLSTSATKRANHDHIEALKNNFWDLAVEMVKDRDAHRAHKYEHKKQAAAKEITLSDVKVHFEKLEKMINAIRSVSTLSSFAYVDTNWAPVKETAQNVVDLIVMGTSNDIFNEFGIPNALRTNPHAKPYFYLYREEFYKNNPAPFGEDPQPETR